MTTDAASPNRRKPFNDRAGYVCSLRSGLLRGHVVVYRAKEAGIDHADDQPWATVCETHSTTVTSSSEKKAREAMKAPESWCGQCGGGDAT